jgi:hypothetical protein
MALFHCRVIQLDVRRGSTPGSAAATRRRQRQHGDRHAAKTVSSMML